MAPVTLPFNVSQKMGLPGPSRAPVAFFNAPNPEIVVTSALDYEQDTSSAHSQRRARTADKSNLARSRLAR